jgi:hypothetical protein
VGCPVNINYERRKVNLIIGGLIIAVCGAVLEALVPRLDTVGTLIIVAGVLIMLVGAFLLILAHTRTRRGP